MLNYKKQIILPLLVASLTLAGALAALFFAVYHLVNADVLDDHIDSLRYEIVSLHGAVSRAETGQRGYLLTNNITFVRNYEAGKADIDRIFSELHEKINDVPSLEPRVVNVRRLIHNKLDSMETTIQTQMNSGAYAPHLRATRMDSDLTERIDAELKGIDRQLEEEKVNIHNQIERALRQVAGGAVVLVLIIIILLIATYRRTIRLFEIAVDSKNVADEYSHDAYHDVLTQLPNRRYFETHLKRMLALGKRNHQTFAILYLDLDGFKQINDQFGHDTGDEALKHAAERFKSALRESDFLSRLGGDEFAVIIDQYYNESELVGLSNRILRYINQPFQAGGHDCVLGVSIGVSRYPDDGQTIEALINAADSAMYQAKRGGKNRTVFSTGKQGW